MNKVRHDVLRVEKGWRTLQAMADDLDVHRNTIALIENEGHIPTYEKAQIIGRALGFRNGAEYILWLRGELDDYKSEIVKEFVSNSNRNNMN